MPPGSRRAGPAGAAGLTPTFRVETRLVEAYASVFDRNGNPLPNLTSEQFQVLDGGAPQSARAFRRRRRPHLLSPYFWMSPAASKSPFRC